MTETTEGTAGDSRGDRDNADGPVCGSTDTRDGSPCQRRVPTPGDRCFMHPADPDAAGLPADHGAPEGNDNALRNDGGPPPANGNAERHGLYTDRSKYYRRLAADEQAWIDALVDAWMDDAPFDRDHLAGLELLRKTAIDEHKRRQANAYIGREGVVTENVVGYDDEGDPIVKKAENPAHLPYSRLAKDTIRTLKQLGILQDPDTQLADAVSWGEAVERAAKRRDRDGDVDGNHDHDTDPDSGGGGVGR